jgi:calcium-dependent phosphoinositide phospholipase C
MGLMDRRVAGLALLVVLPTSACGSSPDEPPDDPCAPAAEIDGLRINQLQVVGSHNSYRRRTYPPLFALIQTLAAAAGPELDPASLDYDHLPIPQQLEDYRMRAVELDLFNDPDGGRFYNRQGLAFLTPPEPVASNIPALLEPGLKVLHIPDVDYETHHYTFRSALETIAAWSAAHPTHVPLGVQLETKESTVADSLPNLGLTTAVPFDAAAANAIDAEIRAVFPDTTRLITPDEVRGTHATLEEAVLAGGWPTVGAARGRIFFFMEGAAVDEYVAGAPGLVGRLVFANSQPGDPHAAIMILNDAIAGQANIADMVGRGYIVRAMSDGGTMEARSGDTTSRDAALASGAQIVSTNYYRPDPRGNNEGSGWTNYKVKVPGGGPARTNPINGGGTVVRVCE